MNDLLRQDCLRMLAQVARSCIYPMAYNYNGEELQNLIQCSLWDLESAFKMIKKYNNATQTAEQAAKQEKK